MKKYVKLFEFFAGIGSQYQALKNLENEMNFKTISLGTCDFFIPSIISYMIIHHGLLKPENELSKTEMIKILKQFSWSKDSKKLVADNYFEKMSESKLKSIFPYLFAYVDNEYFAKKYKFSIDQRERERESYRLSGTDINKYNVLPKDIDIMTYSFPCQDLSQQGKQRGIHANTRSGLLFQIERILKNNTDKLPKILLLENVKALVSNKFIDSLNSWIKTLEILGYHSYYKVVNATEYGSCQNRERVFMVSILNNNKPFVFPKKSIKQKDLSKIILPENEGKSFQHLLKYEKLPFNKTKSQITKSKLLNYTSFNSEAYIYVPIGFGPTLTASGANSRLKFYFEKENILRSINAIETYQYMGFEIKNAKDIIKSKLVTENEMIFTCGNSISVEALEAIFREAINEYL